MTTEEVRSAWRERKQAQRARDKLCVVSEHVLAKRRNRLIRMHERAYDKKWRKEHAV